MRLSTVRLRGLLIITLAGMLGLAGCTGKSPVVDFYVLKTISATGPPAALSPEIAVAVGPVSVPAELDRQQILTRDNRGKIKIAEFHRWAGPLQDNITAVLAADLAVRLGTQKVAPYNRASLFPFTHHVILNINRFDGHPNSEVVMDVTWSIKKTDIQTPLLVQRTEIRQPVATPDYNAMVAAQSKALSEFSTRIAHAIRQLAP